jgi:hypothetical protein
MVDIEALWSVQFVTNLGMQGAGVIVLETERAFGGDAQYYYIGKFKSLPLQTIEAEITATHYAGPRNSVFGDRDKFTVKLTGKYSETTADLEGYLIDNPHQRIKILLTRRALLL